VRGVGRIAGHVHHDQVRPGLQNIERGNEPPAVITAAARSAVAPIVDGASARTVIEYPGLVVAIGCGSSR
jgi:hypothetical protein